MLGGYTECHVNIQYTVTIQMFIISELRSELSINWRKTREGKQGIDELNIVLATDKAVITTTGDASRTTRIGAQGTATSANTDQHENTWIIHRHTQWTSPSADHSEQCAQVVENVKKKKYESRNNIYKTVQISSKNKSSSVQKTNIEPTPLSPVTKQKNEIRNLCMPEYEFSSNHQCHHSNCMYHSSRSGNKHSIFEWHFTAQDHHLFFLFFLRCPGRSVRICMYANTVTDTTCITNH